MGFTRRTDNDNNAAHHAALVGTLMLCLAILAAAAMGSLVILGSVFVKYQRAIGHYW